MFNLLKYYGPLESGFMENTYGVDPETALERARHDAAVSQWVLTIVEEQAVWKSLDSEFLPDSFRFTDSFIAHELRMKKRHVRKVFKRLRSKETKRRVSREIMPFRERMKLSDSFVGDVEERVVRAWSAPLWRSVEQLESERQLSRPYSRNVEISKEIRGQGEAGADWPYQLAAYAFPGNFEETRDSLVMALRHSSWMADNIRWAGSKEDCTLWGVSEELAKARDTERELQVLVALEVLAEEQGCWIHRIHAPDSTTDSPREEEQGLRTSKGTP